MEWTDEGLILNVRPHGETSAIVDLLTREHGRHAGLVHGGRGRRMRPVLQPGNEVTATWRGRLHEHLGNYVLELERPAAAEIMQDRLALAALNALCAVSIDILPDREPHPRIYEASRVLLAKLRDPEIWPALFVQWEHGLLEDLGYGLDLAKCAATGTTENLTHVSPRTGRAVSRSAAEPYLNKLLTLPDFLQDRKAPVVPEDIRNGFELTGYFLERRILWVTNKTLPEARSRMLDLLASSL